MPRNRKRKTDIGLHTEDQMRNALKLIADIETLNDVQLEPLISPSENLFLHQHLTEPASCTPVKQSHAVPDWHLDVLCVEPPRTSFNGPTPTSSTFMDTSAQAMKFISPFEFRGLPKADPRKGTRAARQKGKTMIATDTPEKDQIGKRAEEHKRKKTKIQAKAVVKRKVLNNSSSENEETN